MEHEEVDKNPFHLPITMLLGESSSALLPQLHWFPMSATSLSSDLYSVNFFLQFSFIWLFSHFFFNNSFPFLSYTTGFFVVFVVPEEI